MNLVVSSFNWFDLIQIILTILGWFAIFYFGLRQQRINTKEAAKLKVYEEFWRSRNKLQDSFNELSTLFLSGPPFILMESTSILGNVTKDLAHIQKGQQDALEYLNKYLNSVQEANTNFSNQFLEFWRSLEMWLHVMPELETAVRTLTSEYTIINEKVSKLVSYLISLDRWNWSSWNRKDLEERRLFVWEELNNLNCYSEDMMGLIHNELVTPMFGYSKEVRKPQDSRYKVLTRTGLVVIKN